MTLPSATEKVAEEAIGVLDRLGRPRIALTIIGFVLAIDIATLISTGRNLLQFNWSAGNPAFHFGAVAVFLAVYSLYLVAVAPVAYQLVTDLLFALRHSDAVTEWWPLAELPRDPPFDHVSLHSASRDAYEKGDAAFMDRVDAARTEWVSRLKDQNELSRSGFTCLLLVGADHLFGEASTLGSAWQLVIAQPGGWLNVATMLGLGALYSLVAGIWLAPVLSLATIPSATVYHPALARALAHKRRSEREAARF